MKSSARIAIPALAAVLSLAACGLNAYQRTMTGPVADSVRGMTDLKARELWALGPLIALIVAMGVYPKPVLDIVNPSVGATIQAVTVQEGK